jgi:type I restriction enzyme, S subunit
MKEQQEKYNLPKSWINVSLGDILLLEYGKSLPKDSRQDGKYPIFGSNGIIGFHNNFSVEGPVVIIGRKGSVGSVHISNENCWPIDTTYFVRPTHSLNFKFVFFLLEYLNLSQLDKSTTIPGLNRDNIYEQVIPLPSLNEQDRIVLKLEELISGIEKSKEQLELSFNKLNIHKRTFFKSLLERKSSSRIFVERKFEDCVINHDNKRIPLSSSIRKRKSGPYRYYGATGVIDHIDNYIFSGKYLLIGEDGANLLSKTKDLSFIVEGQFWVNNHAHIVQAKENITIEYLNFYFNSLDITEYVTGTAQPKLNQANLNRIPVLIPSLDEQLSIVQEMQRALSIIEETEKAIIKGLTQIGLFKQTILNKAFTGKLLEQDSNDEPARILLKRIKTEKEEYSVREKEKKSNSIKIKAMPEKSKSILEILNENIESISSKQLWLSSNKKDDIEEFYAELKKHIESGDIIELSRNGKESFLKLADKS